MEVHESVGMVVVWGVCARVWFGVTAGDVGDAGDAWQDAGFWLFLWHDPMRLERQTPMCG